MPNHVKNIVKMKNITSLPVFTDSKFDFEKIIPMPESLRLEAGTYEKLAIEEAIRKLQDALEGAYLNDRIKIIMDSPLLKIDELDKDKLCESGIQYICNMIRYGAPTWYEWRIANWDTKWNSYENAQISPDIISFETAWAPPIPIIQRLSEMYPESEVELFYASEDIGHGTGYMKCVNGEAYVYFTPDEDSSEAYETYILCWGECKCLEKQEDGTWIRHHCDECDICD